MCEFCTKHGEGEKWYLQAKNYSDDLLSDVRRRRFIEEFVSEPDALATGCPTHGSPREGAEIHEGHDNAVS